jgi:hypothetical protein
MEGRCQQDKIFDEEQLKMSIQKKSLINTLKTAKKANIVKEDVTVSGTTATPSAKRFSPRPLAGSKSPRVLAGSKTPRMLAGSKSPRLLKGSKSPRMIQ